MRRSSNSLHRIHISIHMERSYSLPTCTAWWHPRRRQRQRRVAGHMPGQCTLSAMLQDVIPSWWQAHNMRAAALPQLPPFTTRVPPCAVAVSPGPGHRARWRPWRRASLTSPGCKPRHSGASQLKSGSWTCAQMYTCHSPSHTMLAAGLANPSVCSRHRSSAAPHWPRTMASGGEKPRALVLGAEDRTVVVTRLARSVLRFQDDFLSRESSPAGLLCQAGRRSGALPMLAVLHVVSPRYRTARPGAAVPRHCVKASHTLGPSRCPPRPHERVPTLLAAGLAPRRRGGQPDCANDKGRAPQ